MSAGMAGHGGADLGAPTTYYDGTVRIPGYGDPPDRCRGYQPVGFCEAGHTLLGRSSCGTRYCPDHYKDSIEEAVVNMVAHLAAYREVQEMGAEKRMVHVVASPPQDRRYSARSFWETRTEAYDALEAAGVRGGATVAHPYRTNDRGDHLFESAAESGDLDDGTGKWEFLRDTTDGFDDLTRYIEASPHYHALAAAEDVDGAAAPDGWIVERIRSFSGWHYRDEEAYEDMVATSYYLLTHAGYQDGRQATTYFGDVHPAGFRPEEELTAARWDTIKMMAERVVGAEVDEEADGPGETGRECPREECEAAVVELEELPDRMDDDDWRGGIPADRLATLRGALVWWDGRSDRPPPHAAQSEAGMLEWLHDLGETHTPNPTQAQLPTSVFGHSSRGSSYAE